MSHSTNSSDDSAVPLAVPEPAPQTAQRPESAQPTDAVTEETLAPEEEDEAVEVDRDASFLLFAAMPSWLVSLVVHLIIILVLAMWYLPHIPVFRPDLTIGHPDVVETEVTNLEENATELNLNPTSSQMTIVDAPEITTENPALVDSPLDTEAAPMDVELSPIGFEAADSQDLLQELGAFTGSGLDGRSAAERARLLREAGGTEGSEQAVKRALQWLKRHQNPDGSWSFFHLGGRCNCPGTAAWPRLGLAPRRWRCCRSWVLGTPTRAATTRRKSSAGFTSCSTCRSPTVRCGNRPGTCTRTDSRRSCSAKPTP